MSGSTTLVVGRDGAFVSTAKKTAEVNSTLTETLKGHFVGPMPVDAFLQEYMPAAAKERKTLPRVDFSDVIKASKEKDMYTPFATAVVPLLATNAEVIIGAEEDSDTSVLRPDIGVRILPTNVKSRHVQKGQTAIREAFDFTDTCLVIEVKLSTDDDPFVDNLSLPSCENDSSKGLRSRGQLAHYADEQFSQQHRCHLFHIIIFGSQARFLLWDRSGSIFTTRFDYVDDPEPLARFLWRYTRATAAARGLDPSVSHATQRETDTFREVLCAFIQTSRDSGNGEVPGAYVSLDEAYPISRLQVHDNGKPRVFLTGRFFYLAPGPCGRGTRAYLACGARDRKVYVLKDTWTVKDFSCLDELSTYDILERAGVPSLLRPICGGDVVVKGSQQATRIQELSKQPLEWRAPCSSLLRKYFHFRLVQDVAYPVQCLKNSRELIKVFHDIAICIAKAHEVGVLHRDISVGNILFVRTATGVQGILNDWDHAQKVLGDPACRALFRSATRQFMSITLLKSPGKIHEVIDDNESLFWVLVYIGLHFVAHRNRDFLRYNHPFGAGPHGYIDPAIPASGAHLAKYHVLVDALLKHFPFLSTSFSKLVTSLCNLWQDYHMLQIGESRWVLPTALADIRGKLSSASWLANFLEAAHKDSEGWVENDIVTNQFPPLTAQQEKKYIVQQLTSTFDASHLPESVHPKSTVAAISGHNIQPESDSTNVTKRLEDISDDSSDEYTDGPARKKRKLVHPSDTSTLPPVRRSIRASTSKVPRIQPGRRAKHPRMHR